MELQLCESAAPDEIPDYAEWVAERKLDGVRVYAEDGRLYTRSSGQDVTRRFPEINPPEHHVFDGEIITGNFSFETVLRRLQTEDDFKIELYADRDDTTARLVAFDAPIINGGDIRDEPLTARQELLKASIPDGCGVIYITTHDDPEALWETANEQEWEGIILKDPDAPYEGGRSDAWLKVKRWSEAELPILDHYYTDDDGFVIEVPDAEGEPQKVVVNGQDDQVVVQNGADTAEIQYLETTDDGRYRKPSFKGVV